MTVSDLPRQLSQAMDQQFRGQPEAVGRAPGRLEILGNHTDYNEGVVLSVAVDRFTWFAVKPSPDRTCRIYDVQYGEHRSFDIDKLDDTQQNDWVSYIRGVVAGMKKRGHEVPSFEACLTSNVPLSAGMSSSAALEMSVVTALAGWLGLDISGVERARIGQYAENHFVGANTGLLDQFSSVFGRRDHLVYSDFRSLDVSNPPLPPDVALVVINSMKKHDLTDEYNHRRQCCEKAATFFNDRCGGVTSLRDVDSTKLETMKNEMLPDAYSRALHVVGENERVWEGIELLRKAEIANFGQLLFDSHHSSQENFENSTPELDTLVALARESGVAWGARLSGGGFGGITVHLVPDADAEEYVRSITDAYKQRTGIQAQTMICHAEDGATLVE